MSISSYSALVLNPSYQPLNKAVSPKNTFQGVASRGQYQNNTLMQELQTMALASMPFISFKGVTTPATEKAVKKDPQKNFIRKKSNIVISREPVSKEQVKYTFTNVHYIENQLNGLRKNARQEVIHTTNTTNRAIELTGNFEKPLAPMVLYSAIVESQRQGFEGQVLWNIKDPNLLNLAYEYGFELTDKDFHRAFKENDEETIRQRLYENLFNDSSFELRLPCGKAEALKKAIIEEFKTEINQNPTFPILERGAFVNYPDTDIFSICRTRNGALKAGNSSNTTELLSFARSADDKAIIANTSGSDTLIKINGLSFLKNEKAQIDLYDLIKIDTDLYMHTREGLRLITDNADLFEKLYPNGIQKIAFSQGAVGDCYLCASLQGLSLRPEGIELLAKLISKTPEGDYVINFPGFPEEKITIDQNDKVYKYDGLKSDSLGLRLIEQGFGQLKKHLEYCLKPLSLNDSTEKWLWFGFPSNALYILTGGEQFYLDSSNHTSAVDYEEVYECSFEKMAQKDPAIKQKAERLLAKVNADFDSHVVTAITDMDEAKTDWFFEDGTKIVQNHAYVIEKIDEEARTLDILNPHQTWKPSIRISYDEFFKHFTAIEGVKLPYRSDEHS